MIEKYIKVEGEIEVLTEKGFQKQGEIRKEAIESMKVKCPRCEQLNLLTSKVCVKCGYNFDVEKTSN